MSKAVKQMAPAVSGRRRVLFFNISPCVDGGRYPVKRIAGDRVVVEADLVADGHDPLAGVLRFRHETERRWHEVPLVPLDNDRWRGEITVSKIGRYAYTLHAWQDRFAAWRDGLAKKAEAGQDVQLELRIGADLLLQAAARSKGKLRSALEQASAALLDADTSVLERVRLAQDGALTEPMRQAADRTHASQLEQELTIVVDRPTARFSTWYEVFPRSCSVEHGEHGTLRDCARRLPYVASMGFDVVYLPPIHPIGTTHRKGRNNDTRCETGDPGSPWGIGAAAGGHKAVHPRLGTLEDFDDFVAAAHEHGIEVALDVAFQCSPDHPYVQEHPSWFRIRPDGTVQYAENPPKKYQDIFPLEFDTDDWSALWQELKSIFDFWIGHGVKIFRVDNPHTKPLPFWEWTLSEIKKEHPDVLFLAEAFTRPKVMYALAKLGFTQSYTYFTWRNAKAELSEYLTELTRTEVRDFFRPNFWPNTPDILHATLQHGGSPAFMARYVLAATLSSNCGIYGPAYELGVNTPREPGSEEYLSSEKYEIKVWQLDHPSRIRDLIAKVNAIRRGHPALQQTSELTLHGVSNDQLICYSKRTPNYDDVILVVVNLDPHHRQNGWTVLDLPQLGLWQGSRFTVEDLLTGAAYTWQGPNNYVELDPHALPAHIFRVHLA